MTFESAMVTGAVPDPLDNIQEAPVTRPVTLHTRTLRSLRVVEFFLPRELLPRELSIRVLVHLGITHWAVEVNDRVLEVRADSGKGPVMQIREGNKKSPEYNTKSIRRYPIGTTSRTDEEIDCIIQKLECSGNRRYHFYSNNCQLIAAALGVASCDKPSTAYTTLVRQRDNLRFLNSSNPSGVWTLVHHVLTPEEYEKFHNELFDDAESQILKLAVRGPVWLGLLDPPTKAVKSSRRQLWSPPPNRRRIKRSAKLPTTSPDKSPMPSNDPVSPLSDDQSFTSALEQSTTTVVGSSPAASTERSYIDASKQRSTSPSRPPLTPSPRRRPRTPSPPKTPRYFELPQKPSPISWTLPKSSPRRENRCTEQLFAIAIETAELEFEPPRYSRLDDWEVEELLDWNERAIVSLVYGGL